MKRILHRCLSGIILFSVLLIQRAGATNITDREIAEMERGLSYFREIANKAKESRSIEFADELGLGLLKTSRKRNLYAIGNPEEVFKALQEAFLSIPGHALHYRDRINTTRSELEKALAAGEINMIGSVRAKIYNEVTYGLETLGNLPSPETVGVLGEFLFDERGFVDITGLVPTEENMYLAIRDGPVFAKAAAALDALPIVAKPVQTKIYYVSPSDTEPWRQWYREIKEGKRTFRFEGDATEYDLNGPAPSQKIERIARDTKRERERAAGRLETSPGRIGTTDSAAENESSAPLFPLLAAGMLVLGTLVWYVTRRIFLRTAG